MYANEFTQNCYSCTWQQWHLTINTSASTTGITGKDIYRIYELTTFIIWRSFWQEFCARLIWWLDYNGYVVGWDSTEVFFDYQGIRLERYRFCCIIKLAWVLCYSKNFTITKYYKYSFHGYHMIQNIGGRKFWQNSSYQKLADNILVDAQNFQNA